MNKIYKKVASIGSALMTNNQQNAKIDNAYDVRFVNEGSNDVTIKSNKGATIFIPRGPDSIRLIAPPNALISESFSIQNSQPGDQLRLIFTYESRDARTTIPKK